MNSFKKGLLIFNGKAGRKGLNKNLQDCVPVLAEQLDELTLMRTQKAGDGERLCREHGSRYDIVFILGGDGTVHECLNGIAQLDAPPTVSVLPSGTCNDFSRLLKVPQDISEASRLISTGEVAEMDLGKVNDRIFSNFWGIGLISEASENINASSKNMLGKISYYISALQTVKEAMPFSFKITCDEQVIEDEAVMILVANGCFIGTNRLPLSKICADDGMLDILIIRQAGFELFKNLITGEEPPDWNHDDSNVIHIQAKECKIETQELMKADMDGEVYEEGTPAHLSALQKKVSFLRGDFEY
ncbi:diacylglycerol/lipid kinase family protein [Falsibacillus albus]|uniref:YegS/Rv2252/BmrU family lipid kinase n=1 Tax=Falsibacillus albus TaxID=2478915 RepID=A0A3L7JQV0_9BACI|nr:YegS/Rv2252/BmrU family lipid kinase [Falsibacillus albus]RLQ93197.1 YegS/Rv2252/BmrU family lipid kinase [Falsibacillus albus]